MKIGDMINYLVRDGLPVHPSSITEHDRRNGHISSREGEIIEVYLGTDTSGGGSVRLHKQGWVPIYSIDREHPQKERE